MRAPRAPFASTTCAPSVPHGSAGSMRASGGTLGVHVAHFRPMCLTAWNSPRHPTSPILSRTGPTGFDARSSRGGRPERTLGECPHVLGARVVPRKGAPRALHAPPCTARAGALRVPGEVVSACVLRGALHRATRGLQGLQGLRTVWGSEVPGAPEIFLFYFFQFEKNKKICLSLPLFSKKECKVCKVCSTLFTTPPPPPPRAPPWPYHSGPTWRSRARPP